MPPSPSSLTIQDLLHNRCLQLASEISSHGEALCDQLEEQLEGGKRRLLGTHRERTEGGGQAEGKENDNNTFDPSAAAASNDSNDPSLSSRSSKRSKPPSSPLPPTLHILVEGGPHDGSKFSLRPGVGKTGACFVGRSTGKKFTDKGLSLPKVSGSGEKWREVERERDARTLFRARFLNFR